jgi:hypothetical protein
MRRSGVLMVVGAVLSLALTGAAGADAVVRSGKAEVRGHGGGVVYRRSGTRVRGYIAGRGGYSFGPNDAVSPYGPYFNRYYYEGPYVLSRPRQTPFGPFDSGFFFDSGIEPRGGFAPYQN